MYLSSILLAGGDKLTRAETSCDWQSLEDIYLSLRGAGRGRVKPDAGLGLTQALGTPVVSCTRTAGKWECGVFWVMASHGMFLSSWFSSAPVSQPLLIRTSSRACPHEWLLLWSLLLPTVCLGSIAKPREPVLWGFIAKNKAHPPYLSLKAL